MEEKKNSSKGIIVVLVVLVIALCAIIGLVYGGVIKFSKDKCVEAISKEKKEKEEDKPDCLCEPQEKDDEIPEEKVTKEVNYKNEDIMGRYDPDFSKMDTHHAFRVELNKNGTYLMEPTCDDTCTTGGTIMFGNYYIEGNKIIFNQIIYFNQQTDDFVSGNTYEGTINEDGTINSYDYKGDGSKEKNVLVVLKRTDNTDHSDSFEENVDNIVNNY